MSFETSLAFVRLPGEPTPEHRFRGEFHQEKAARTPSRRRLLDASAVDTFRAVELARFHGHAPAI